jgi:hypothetical protein
LTNTALKLFIKYLVNENETKYERLIVTAYELYKPTTDEI